MWGSFIQLVGSECHSLPLRNALSPASAGAGSLVVAPGLSSASHLEDLS